MKQEKDNDRVKQDVNETSRTMKPGKTVKASSDASKAATTQTTTGKGAAAKPDKRH